MKFQTIWMLIAAAAWPAAAQETIDLPVGPLGVAPMHFELRDSGVVRMADAIVYQGDASLVTPLGRMVLAQSQLVFNYAPGTQQVQSVRGQAFVPTPLSGQKVSIDNPVMAEVGYDLGANIKDLEVPLLDNRGYLFFKFDAGLSMHVGQPPPEGVENEEDTSFTISFPAGATARIIVDPLDPMFYYSGAVTIPHKSKTAGKPADGTNDENPPAKDHNADEEDEGISTGSGTSQQGLFPFRPLVTWGIEDKAREFLGQRILTGTFPLFALPVTVRGHLITNLDPLATGELAADPLGIGFGPLAQAGANGRFALSLDFLKAAPIANVLNLNLTIPLGKATAAVEIANDRQLAYLSGLVDPATDLGFDLLLSHDEELKAAALVSSNPAESRLYMEGWYKVGASEFGKQLGMDLGNILRIEGGLRADQTGFFLHGLSEAGLYMGPITSQQRIAVDLNIPSNEPDDRYMQLAGLMNFAGLGTDATARVSHDGLTLTGKLTAPKFDMTVNAGVKANSAGPYVFGNMSVPEALTPDFQGAIEQASREVQSDLDSRLSDYRAATGNFEFELSLRGMRTVVPPVMDAIVSEINRQIPAGINARWPRVKTLFGTIEAPGKNAAIRIANADAEPYRQRLRTLKAAMQAADSTTVRAALEAAILSVLNNPRIRVTYKVPVAGATITIIDYTFVSSSLRAELNNALAGVRALPEASDRKVSAEQAWNHVPKREILRQAADAIENNITAAIPRIESIGFQFPLSSTEWNFQVVVTQQGKQSTVGVRVAPDNIVSIGTEIGRALAQIL